MLLKNEGRVNTSDKLRFGYRAQLRCYVNDTIAQAAQYTYLLNLDDFKTHLGAPSSPQNSHLHLKH